MPPKKIVVIKCGVVGCDNNTAVNKERMFKFPRGKMRRKQWIELIGRTDLVANRSLYFERVCEAHFSDAMRENGEELTETAYPDRNLPDPASIIRDPAPSTSADQDADITMEEDDVFELEKEIAEMLSSTNTLLKEGKTGLVRFERSKFMDTYESWRNKMKEKYQGHMYKKKLILHCLNVYCKAPKAYPIFKTTFSLPSLRRLKKTKINLPPGINENFIKLVGKQLVNIPKSEKIIVCLEQIAINRQLYYDIRHDNIIGYHDIGGNESLEVASFAFMIWIKGCYVNYQQMIGYCFVRNNYQNKDISKWIDGTIRTLFMVGLNVCAVVSEQTASLLSLAKFKGVTRDDPSFKVDGKVIYYIFDFPQMINGIRESLICGDFLYNEKMASWEHLQMLYQVDMERRIKLAPKLKVGHLEPNSATKVQLQIAQEVFSRTVAAAISVEIDENRLPLEAEGTVDFFMIMNDLINICNSTRTFSGGDRLTKSLENALKVFKDIQVISRATGDDLKNELKYFDGIIMSINAILQMNQYFRLGGLKYFPTKRFHLQPEQMRGDLIQHCKRPFIAHNAMIAIELKRAFSALSFSNLIKNSSLTNYKMYLDRLILAQEDINDFSLLEEYIPNPPKSSPLVVGTTDYRFKLPLNGIFQHICSYLLKKCSSKHNCALFKEYLDNSKLMDKKVKKNPDTIFVPKEFIAYVNKCENIFIKEFDKIIVIPNLGLNLYNLLTNEFQPCPCFPCDYLKKLFLRIRIYNVVKFRNLRFSRVQIR